jgi:hypothetical protein
MKVEQFKRSALNYLRVCNLTRFISKEPKGTWESDAGMGICTVIKTLFTTVKLA